MTTLQAGTIMCTAFRSAGYPGVGGSDLTCTGGAQPIAEGALVTIHTVGHAGDRLLVHTVDEPILWAWVWSDMLETPLQEAPA